MFKTGARLGKYHTYCRSCLSELTKTWAIRRLEHSCAEQPSLTGKDAREEPPTCRRCNRPKDYVIKSGKRQGMYHTYCRRCLSDQVRNWADRHPERSLERQRAWLANNPEKQIRYRVRRYGVDEVWYMEQFARQNGLCAICGRDENFRGDKSNGKGKRYNLSVDHDHETGFVRGLVCNSCNWSLGILENEAWATLARAYLESHRRKS
jgi:hypothetical protein